MSDSASCEEMSNNTEILILNCPWKRESSFLTQTEIHTMLGVIIRVIFNFPLPWMTILSFLCLHVSFLDLDNHSIMKVQVRSNALYS
jgi:hypothetical protein